MAGTGSTLGELLPELDRLVGPNHRDTLVTRNLAAWRGEAGDTMGAVAAFEELLADMAQVLGPSHPDTMAIRDALTAWREQQDAESPEGSAGGVSKSFASGTAASPPGTPSSGPPDTRS